MLKRLSLIALVGLGSATLPTRAEDAKPAAEKAAVEAPKVGLPAPDADGFITLFNGKDLTGWEGLPDYWEVRDGAIVGHETKDKSKQTFLIYKGANVSDFELHLKFKFASKDGNSGVQFRSKVIDEKICRVGGYQADFDAGNKYTGIIYDEAGVAGKREIMSNRGEKTRWDAENKRQNEKLDKTSDELKNAIKIGDWNDVVLKVAGNHVTYAINGNTTTELTDESPNALKDGVLALQLHAGFTMEIQFKDIKLKPAAGAKADAGEKKAAPKE